MCGLSGVFFDNSSLADEALDAVQKMNIRMNVRGPDALGVWQGRGVVLGHRRLAIQDLDVRANQPFLSIDGRYVIVFNGEIYNFNDLRRNLEADGVVFRTSSDTEVLLHLYIKEGAGMLPKLRGMFAFAVWDDVEQSLFLARDPYGIKPLFYSTTPSGFVFASQVKALKASGLIPLHTELAGLAAFYLWGSVPAPWTLYRDVFALMPGNYLLVRAGNVGAPVCWQDIRSLWQDDAGGVIAATDLTAIVREAVNDSVQAHMVADVPVGVFLSGGIDSGVLVGLATQIGKRVEGITISFAEFAGGVNDEVPRAAAIAAQYGIKHHVRFVTHDEFQQDLPLILDAMDLPTIDGINTWFASKAAAELGYKVVLSGIGADELFCGYPSFSELPFLARLGKLASKLGVGALQRSFDWLAHWKGVPKLAGVPSFMNSIEGLYYLKRGLFLPGDLPILMGPDQAKEGLTRLGGNPPGLAITSTKDDINSVSILESLCYLRNQLLPDTDWASMAHSLEVRTPFVDTKLLTTLGEYVPNFRKGRGKRILSITPLQPLSNSLFADTKTGFSTPIDKWIDQNRKRDVGSTFNDFPPDLLASHKTHWSRRWAVTVAKSFC